MHKLLTGILLIGALGAATAFGADASAKAATVGLIPKLDTDPYFGVAKTGAEEAQKEIGGSVIQEAPSSATGDAQIEFINNLVSQKVDVIAIAGNDPNAVAPALKRAQAQGVRVISYDSDVAKNVRGLFINQVNFDSVALQMLESMG
jgi:rhamnose transport system substrate-binding protein